jgi:L-ascorbate metabolism protein UlaG (beta-lactamase superfamily)
MRKILALVALVGLQAALGAMPSAPALARPSHAISRTAHREPVVITYLGNAGWQIEAAGKLILVDPYLTQFRNGGLDNRNTDDNSDPILTPDQAGIDAHVRRADYILITHGHSDHMLDAPYISNRYHAPIVCSPGSANIARAYGVPDQRLIVVQGGEDYSFDGFSLRVIPSLHSPLLAKRYNDTIWAGTTPPGLHAPLHESAFVENGTFVFLLRIGGHRIFIMGGMNYIDTLLPGLRPDIAIIGAGASRNENYDYARRLMTGLDHPAIVLPTHWDSYGNMTRQNALLGAAAFSREIRAASPRSRVIIPDYFSPIRLP